MKISYFYFFKLTFKVFFPFFKYNNVYKVKLHNVQNLKKLPSKIVYDKLL